MKYPYLITSDQHAHNWSAFHNVLDNGVNSRLQIILDEMQRAHDTLELHGGHMSFYAGDLFHVRGAIHPSVFNPTFEKISALHNDVELRSYAIPGNHDLEGKHASELGNAMQQLAQIPGFSVLTKSHHIGDVIVIPWYQDLAELRAELETWASRTDAHKLDVIIHAPVNGVITGIPDHGLEAKELAAYGFRRVFAGHYHDHRVFEGGKVISIGATTHQTWNDPGTKAGFLLVWEDRIEHFESQAPKFIDLLSHEVSTEGEIEDLVRGNYVRLKLDPESVVEKDDWRDQLLAAGALGVTIIPGAKKVVSRSGTTITASKTMEASVSEFIDHHSRSPRKAAVQAICADLLAQARSA